MGSSFSSDGGEQSRNTSIVLNSTTSMDPTEVPLDGGVNVTNSYDDPLQSRGPNYDITNNNHSNDLTRQSASLNTSSNPFLTNNGTSMHGTSSGDFKFELFGTYVYPFRWLTLPTLYSWLGPLSSLAMVIGCVMPYVPQYRTIYKNQNCAGFSTFVCFTLLLANILRIAFWFGHPFELPLLIQSVIMISAQLLLLELCVRVKRKCDRYANTRKKRTFFACNVRYFWRWDHLTSYLEFLCLITILIGVATYYLIDCEPYIEAIGYCSLVTESMLGLPQVIKNYKNKSVDGMSLSMVLMWMAGDTFKTAYFIWNNVPYQFWLCGLLQITIDLLILFQVCLFRRKALVKLGSRTASWPKEMMAL